MAGTGLLATVSDVFLESPMKAALYLFFAFLAYQVTTAISTVVYNLFFHPLRDIPGPKLAAACNTYANYYHLTGQSSYNEAQMHAKYGPIVRAGPDLIFFTEPQAWKDIYGHRIGGRPSTTKPPAVEPAHEGHDNLEFCISDEEHGARRRLYAHAFSDSAMKKQEPILQGHVSKLIQGLRNGATSSANKGQDLVAWLHFCTFDIMGDLAFGHKFNMLDGRRLDPWVEVIISAMKAFTFVVILKKYWPLRLLINTFLGSSIKKSIDQHRASAVDRVDKRLDDPVDRPDIWGLVLKADPDRLPSRWAMHEDGMLFMQAGTDTTSSLLSGLSWHLLKNPKALAKLTHEIRGAYGNQEEMSIESLARLPYLAACIEEGLRVYPPSPVGMPRIVPAGGLAVCGRFFSPGTQLAVPQYATYHSERNFALADEFHPERWLGTDERFANDKKDALQPFLYGPRNCIGKNLAYVEMRLILASIVLNFDLELAEESCEWMPHEMYGLWQKPPLWIRFRPRA